MLTRRSLLALGGGGLLLPSLLPGRAFGDGASPDRKFLFVFCPGGWDPTYVFAPLFGNPLVDMEPAATTATANGIPFVDAASRPSVRAFFEDFGDRACVVNGMEVRSVAHDVCRRIAMTGSSLPGGDDWAAILGANAADAPPLPFVHISGPAYGNQYGSAVVRVGSKGQFGKLLDGSALTESTPPILAPSATLDGLEDAYALARAEAFAAAAARGRAARIGELAVTVEKDLAAITERGALALGGGDLADGLADIVSLFQQKLARCGMIAFNGHLDWGWDTHSSNDLQDLHFEELFAALNTTLRALDALPGDRGTLLDDTTVVVVSEMGRYPQLNNTFGKEHWTFTSCLLVGGGVAGGQVIGEYDSNAAGRPVDLASGAATDDGVLLVPGNLGATLLTIAGVDPAEFVGDAPIAAAIA